MNRKKIHLTPLQRVKRKPSLQKRLQRLKNQSLVKRNKLLPLPKRPKKQQQLKRLKLLKKLKRWMPRKSPKKN